MFYHWSMAFPPPMTITLAPELRVPQLRLIDGGRNDQSPWVYAGDAARLLGLSRTEVMALVDRGMLAASSHPERRRVRRIRRDEVDRLRTEGCPRTA